MLVSMCERKKTDVRSRWSDIRGQRGKEKRQQKRLEGGGEGRGDVKN